MFFSHTSVTTQAMIIAILLLPLFPLLSRVTCLEPIVVRAGVLLTANSTLMYDMQNVRPALEVGYATALAEYNVKYETIWIAYDDHCSASTSVGQCANLVLRDNVDVIIGPGCSDDLIIVCEITSFFNVPLLSGGGEWIDTTFMYPWLIRFSFGSYSLWRIFSGMMKVYDWSNVVILTDCCDYPKNVTTRGLVNRLNDLDLQSYVIRFKYRLINATDLISGYLKDASMHGRIVVLSMDSLLLRKFMLEANRLGMCEGEYAFFTLDMYMDDLIGIGKNGWQQNDGNDEAAKHAYGSLFILTLMNKRTSPAYQKFMRDVEKLSAKQYPGKHVDINYHTSAFHDSVIMFAACANLTVQEGLTISRNNVAQLSQRFWGKAFDGGASGRVLIDVWGDRLDDHSLYHMDLINGNGEFVVVANYFGYRGEYEPGGNITWPGMSRQPPQNQPRCGFNGQDAKCKPKTQVIEITVGVAVALLFLLGLFGFLMYRKIKLDAKLTSMDWLGYWSEISYSDNTATSQTKVDRRLSNATTRSKASKGSGTGFTLKPKSTTSTHSSGSAAYFRGNIVLLRMCEKSKIELTAEVLSEVRKVRSITHENLLRFVGAIMGPDKTAVICELCTKGNLQNLLSNDAIKLDDLFKYSMIMDIIKAMSYVHSSQLRIHGRLTSRCCWIDSRFVLKVGDYGLQTFYQKSSSHKEDNNHFVLLLWQAPEVIIDPNAVSQEGDVYSFGIILQEIILREEPFAMFTFTAQDLVARILKDPEFRPLVEDADTQKDLITLMKKCWVYEPQQRPKFAEIRTIIRNVSKNDGQQGTILDTLLKRMELYAQNLESLVEEKTRALVEEQRKADELLNQLLPKSVAEQLKKGQQVHPESYESVTIYFSDIVGFTTLSSDSLPMEIVDFLNDLYTCFDNIITQYNVYKVETIGDSYMCVSGLPVRNGVTHAVHIARMALALLGSVQTFKIRHRPDEQLKLRIGLHSGPCVAGVVGLTMPRYCLFGDTVNTASRMESTGEALKIQISSFTKAILDGFHVYVMHDRGEIAVKGKGAIHTYWLISESVSESES